MYSYLPIEWARGITKDTLQEGRILNDNYISGGTESQYFHGDISFSYEWDTATIENYIQLNAYIQEGGLDGLGLTRVLIPTTGDETYNLKVKCADIKYIARYIKCNIISVASSTSFNVPLAYAEIMENYHQAKLTANGLGTKLVCNITKADSTEYIREFTISGQTITLTSAISGLSANDTFELISCYDILKDGTEKTTGLPPEHYIIKYVNPTQNASFKFYPLSKPDANIDSYIVVYYNAISETKPRYYNTSSIEKYGIKRTTKDIDFVINSDQLDAIYQELQKKNEPLFKLTLKTLRPVLAKKGWKIPVEIPSVYTGELTVIDNKTQLIHVNGQKTNELFTEQTVTLSNYQSNLVKLLAGLRKVSQIKQNILDNLEKANSSYSIMPSWFFDAGLEETYIPNYDWDYTGLTKGFYLNFANSDLTNIATSETATGGSGTYGNAFYTYNGLSFNGTNNFISVTNNLMSHNEIYTQITFKIQFKMNSNLSTNQIKRLITASIWNTGLYLDYTIYLRNVSGVNYLEFASINNIDYGYPNFAIISKDYNFVSNTNYSIILSLDIVTKNVTLIINNQDYSSSVSKNSNFTSVFNRFRVNQDNYIKTDVIIGKDAEANQQYFDGIIWRPFVQYNKYITPTEAQAEQAKFGF